MVGGNENQTHRAELGGSFPAAFAVGYKQPLHALNLCGVSLFNLPRGTHEQSQHNVQDGSYNSFNDILASSGRRHRSVSSFPFLAMCESVEKGPCSSVSFAGENVGLVQMNSQG